MARAPKPWFRKDRQAYFVTIRGTHHLGADKKEADRRFHELMAQAGDSPPPAPPASAVLTVAEVFDKFLDWCQKHRAHRTYEWSRGHIQAFCDHLKKALTMPALDLRPFHIVEWVDSKATWGEPEAGCHRRRHPFVQLGGQTRVHCRQSRSRSGKAGPDQAGQPHDVGGFRRPSVAREERAVP